MPASASYRIYVVRRCLQRKHLFKKQHSATYAISSCVNSDLRNTKSRTERNNNISYLCTEYFLEAIKKQWDVGSGRILLGDNTVGAIVKLRLVRFRRVEASISTELIYIYIYTYTGIPRFTRSHFTRFRYNAISSCNWGAWLLAAASVQSW
jgi:hypothetical protein